ncbi:MAG: ABC transporter ATP-binding protein [Firmicutes bacterium]|nr:ABC transporter ATP-binding protein [Bacillota bacterium]
MKNNENKRTLREDWALIRRAIGILNEIMPGFWFWQAVCTLLETFTPYFGLYMSAQMVNELAGDCNPKKMLILAGITVVVGFVISVVTRFIQSRRTMKDYLMFQKHEAYMIDVQNNLQYEHLENPDVVLLRSKIFAAMAATGGGINTVKWAVQGLVGNILNIVFSVSLTVSMFSMAAEGEFTGIFAFINSPFSAVIIIALIVVNTVLSIRMSNDSTVKINEVVADLAQSNTILGVYSRAKGSDMIIFNLNRIVMEEYRRYQLSPVWIKKMEQVQIKFGVLSMILNAVLNIALFLFVAAKAFIGVFGIGNFLLYQGTTMRFLNAVSNFASEFGRLRHNNVYLIQFYEFLDLPNDMYRGTLAVEKRDDIDYEIEFRDVSFKYPRTDTWALRHVGMKFKIGDKLAIVGENGSGKTTFIKLLCRLYDPTEGKILLNGIDITRYRYDEYMALFSVVFQDYTLFGFPLGENVAADCTYDDKKVRDCLIRVGLGDKLESLENDPDAKEKDPLKRAIGREYDSEGIEFSGGERQKIALARALYKDAPFVVLDEPTAALDPIAEAAVYENFNVFVENKTAVFISHRLSSCRFCDEIAVFDHGQLVQLGSHDTLLEDTDGEYSRLWYAQAQYYEK